MLAQKTPLNLTNGSVIDTGNALTYFNQKGETILIVGYENNIPKFFIKKKALLK